MSIEPISRLAEAELPRLTIAIPTYNRLEDLQQTLASLGPRLTSAVCIRVIDNASDFPLGAPEINALGQGISDFRIVRNAENIGLCANICRCVELCETEWLWIIADDDLIVPEAISAIFVALGSGADLDALYFSSIPGGGKRGGAEIECRNIQSLLRNLPGTHLSNIWLPSFVFRTAAARECLRFGYLFGGSFAPHFAILLAILGKRGGKVRIVHAVLADYRAKYAVGLGYNSWSVYQGLATILDFPMTDRERKELARLVIASMPGITREIIYILGSTEGLPEHSSRFYAVTSGWTRLFCATGQISIAVRICLLGTVSALRWVLAPTIKTMLPGLWARGMHKMVRLDAFHRL